MHQTTLIPMLGTSQLDELVLYPQTTIQDVSPTLAVNGAMQPLSKARIERNLDDIELNHSRDYEDDIVSVFSGEGLPGDMTCWYQLGGEDRDIFRILCTVDLPIPPEKWGHALLACNQHHRTCNYGRCSLVIKEGRLEGKLFFESLIDLSEGVTDSYLQRHIMLSLFASHVFFEKTGKQKLLVPARPRKRNKTTHKQAIPHK
jgi:hypothetical protein